MTDVVTTENAANAANFEELTDHINLVNQRLKSLAPSSDKYEQSLEDVQDYYERAIQDRKMRIVTLEEQIIGATGDIVWYWRAVGLLSVACIGLGGLACATLFPNQSTAFADMVRPFATPDRVVVNVILVIVAFVCAKKK